MNIVVDGMGGDFAPKNVIEGVKLALAERKDITKLLLTGDEQTLKNAMQAAGLSDRRIEIVHASQVVDMHDPATAPLRQKKDSSITVAADLVKKGEAEAVFSAGHTGASVAATSVKWRMLKGVDRPGIASPVPAEHGLGLILDAGANVDAKPQHLVQYAVMGSVYLKHVIGVQSPKIGLMSVGEEDHKGTDFTREVFGLLKDAPVNFVGNIEGNDIFDKGIDVILCDGFTGNVVLKTCEGTAKIMFKWLKSEIKASPLRMLGALIAKNAFKSVKERGSYESYGGSPLLGVNGICIIGHGSSSALAVKNGIRVACESVSHRVNPHIEEELAKLGK
ncbi:phosphate acyltransferase PlsX [Sulfuriroseicoccus oceanibius]|uniref:Phosphate acyltransferase n=1 Tax=Sulfuriroseicoccus oceanibius TaxID=2707525 RepID=A0A6B3L9R6_9BACT|nr:phosphate acyltransferase PlsX [Sulfuriroseicoccus oceanibius]QQL46296.1 phosphate acyltransferase PlsX [Sulfuriroseicoccus oceanibius]